MRGMALLLSLMALGEAQASCTPGALLAEYRATPSLLASTPGSTLVVQVFRDGCTAVTLPRQYRRAGDYALWLAPHEFETLQIELAQSGLERLTDKTLAERVRAQREALPADAPQFLVTDEDVLEFRYFPTGKRPTSDVLRLTHLREDVLNLPGDRDLLALAALRATFEGLAQRMTEASP